jgi:hypothetical protein
MPPICMGFYQTWRNNLRWIGHEGDLIAFHSLFFVEPAQKLVLFISYNSAGGADQPRPEIINMFADRYFPAEMKQDFISLPRQELQAIAGTYESTRRSDSTKLKLANLFEQRSASVNKDGVLHIADTKDLRGHTIKWKPISKDLWQEIDGQRRLFAIRNESGRIVRLAGDFPGVQADRVIWYENNRFVGVMAGISFVVLAMVIAASLSRLARRIFLRKRPKPAPQTGTRWLPLVSQVAAWIWVTMFAAIFIFFAVNGDDLMPPTPAWDKYLYLINGVTALALLLSVFAIISGIRVWRTELRSITKVKYSLVALACAVLCWLAIHWNVIGPVTRI